MIPPTVEFFVKSNSLLNRQEDSTGVDNYEPSTVDFIVKSRRL